VLSGRECFSANFVSSERKLLERVADATPPQLPNAAKAFAGSRRKDVASVAAHAKCNVWPCQCEEARNFHHVVRFRLVRFEKFPPCRHRLEQVLYAHGSSACHCAGTLSLWDSIVHDQLRSEFIGGAARAYCESRNAANGRERLSAEAECAYAVKVFKTLYFAGGVAFYGHWHIFRPHAASVIAHRNRIFPGAAEAHVYFRSTGVQCIFHQFLKDGRRALNDFSGRHTPYHHLRQTADWTIHGPWASAHFDGSQW
jgi:hypothetical protein